MRRSVPPPIVYPGMSFAERHPWMVMRLGMDADYIPRRFSNELCAAHSMQMYGRFAHNYQIMHAYTGLTLNWTECLDQ